MTKGGSTMASNTTDIVAYDPAMFPNLLDQDPQAVKDRFTKRFAAANSMEDLFSVLQGTSSKDMVGRKVRITGVSWAPYESEHGVIPLAVCDAVDLDTGEVTEFATTGDMLVKFIRRAELIDAIPFEVRITSKKTRNGFNALNFEPV